MWYQFSIIGSFDTVNLSIYSLMSLWLEFVGLYLGLYQIPISKVRVLYFFTPCARPLCLLLSTLIGVTFLCSKVNRNFMALYTNIIGDSHAQLNVCILILTFSFTTHKIFQQISLWTLTKFNLPLCLSIRSF